jgi:hypothetical protein
MSLRGKPAGWQKAPELLQRFETKAGRVEETSPVRKSDFLPQS